MKATSEDGDVLMRRVGTRLERLRHKQRLTLKAVADRLGTSGQYVARCEQGTENFSLRTLAKLANAFGVRVVDLVR